MINAINTNSSDILRDFNHLLFNDLFNVYTINALIRSSKSNGKTV